jgi:hypothetical protein
MAHPYNHALSSARRHGGVPEDYIPLHSWLDASKEMLANFRHRALRHHSQGIFEAERVFGITITNSRGERIPTRILAEQHVREDCGYIPTVADWLSKIPAEDWMHRPASFLRLEPEPPVMNEAVEVHALQERWDDVEGDSSVDPPDED